MIKTVVIAMMVMATQGAMAKDVIKVSSGEVIVDDTKISYKGKTVPVDEDAMSVDVTNKYVINGKDIILFSQSSGGNACPATYFFVTINGTTAQRSPIFGSCSDLIKVKQDGNKLVATMPKMNGKGINQYVFDNDKLTENGKILK